MAKQQFRIGDLVQLKADSSRWGSIVKVMRPIAGKKRYLVFDRDQNQQQFLESQLRAVQPPAVLTNSSTPLNEFRAKVTAFRFCNPLVDSLYSLHSARIDFIPFQLKPLIRILKADQPRILIADDVGVGKTIEAGIILRELQVRKNIKRILIVCPKALVHKWHAEMLRFDETFKPLTSEDLKYCLLEAHNNGAWPGQYSKSIINLELLRLTNYLHGSKSKGIPGLLELQTPPSFDLLIVDEAHHLRSTAGNTRKLAKFLSTISQNVIFLTATPIQTKSQNLFTLLNLLRPDIFRSFREFKEIVEPNKYLNTAIRHIRSKKPKDTWEVDAAKAIQKASETTYGKKISDRFESYQKGYHKLREGPLSNEDRVSLLRYLDDLHTLSQVMNRTRRRDIGKFTIRVPVKVSVPFNKQQQAFYGELRQFLKELLSHKYGPKIMRLIIDTFERQASSCLPAFIAVLPNIIKSGKISEESFADFDSELIATLPSPLKEKANHLLNLVESLPPADPKFDELYKIIQATLKSSGPGKLMVFSFFLRTLSYLEQRLTKQGIRVAVISGKVPDREREQIRERFRLPKKNADAIDVLLSSEVGCEGLDYQFCDRLVNYDIPWNPMRIEQRIGRIDRYGQKSPKVQIFNFITPGTVEERIFYRCFKRLGVFTDTVGDLEDVLGDLTENLNAVLLDYSLNSKEAEKKAIQLTDNAIRAMQEQRKLEVETENLLDAGGLFTQDLQSMKENSQYVSPHALQHFIFSYLKIRCPLSKVVPDSSNPARIDIKLNADEKEILMRDLLRVEHNGNQVDEFKGWLSSDVPAYTVTFSQTEALEDRQVPFITPVHVLSKMAIDSWGPINAPFFTRVKVKGKDTTLKPGTYIFALYKWEVLGVRPSIQLVPQLWDLTQGKQVPIHLNDLLQCLFSHDAVSVDDAFPMSTIELVLNELDTAIHARRQEELHLLSQKYGELFKRKLASVETRYKLQIKSIEKQIQLIGNPSIRRLKESHKSRLHWELESKRATISQKSRPDIVIGLLAYGVMEI